MVVETPDLAAWKRTGALLIDDFLSGADLRQVQGWVDDIEVVPGTSDGVLQYDELTPDGRTARCRTENIVPFHGSGRISLIGHFTGNTHIQKQEQA